MTDESTSLTDRTRSRVDREVARLRERYGDVAVEDETATNEPSYFQEGKKLAEVGWLGDAGAFVTDDEDRALLIRHADDPDQRIHMLTVEFEADYEGGEIDVGDEEVVEARWFAEPPATVHEFLEEKIGEWDEGE